MNRKITAGWSINWQTRWSHHRGNNPQQVVPCSWQTTPSVFSHRSLVLRGGLGGHLNLTRRLADRRIGKTENLTSDVVFHRYLVSSMSDLDEEFGQWLAEARAVGNGAHPAR